MTYNESSYKKYSEKCGCGAEVNFSIYAEKDAPAILIEFRKSHQHITPVSAVTNVVNYLQTNEASDDTDE